ncbi:hypothetical protein BG910_08265 [Neisseria chenwenguii]|uniref:Uncharacterized protein n=1 Tax=Neisseria chenwenguii TaxID=1853278 RepID=A0A220S2R8_9NEIS|nr:hypothetical protein BG910_08265 [Neisseria chenwenguii]
MAQKAKDILSNNLENIKNFDKKVSENIENINKEVDASLEKVAETLQTSKESLKDVLSNALDKAAEGIDSLRDWLSDAFQNFAQQLPDLPSEKEWYIDDGKQCLAPWADQNRDGKYHVYDPLVLDLDGDGIETVGTSGYAGALFDHDKDGIRTSTGWVSADDGLLVVDLNGDGKVNNGGELFGDSYALKDGNTAANGFAALAEFDTNSDGIVDANDERFKELKIWRDLDSDGISDAGELFSLADAGVKSLNVAHTDTNKALGNGNTLAQDGSYTKADGTTAQMGDLLLAADHLHSRYADSVTLTKEQARAANLQGIGRLRDLREAAALSPELAEALKAYSAAETKAEQQELLNSLINKWAETDPAYGTGVQFLPPMIKTAGEDTALTRSQEKNYRQAA